MKKRTTCIDKQIFKKNCNILKFGDLMNLTKKKTEKNSTFKMY